MNQTDIKIFKSENITDSSSNGGRIDFSSEVISGVKFNLFPRVTSTQRESGITRYRKAFLTNFNDLSETAFGASVCISTPGNGEDRFYIKQATQTDTQGDLATDGWKGCGLLAYDAASGASSIQVSYKSNDYTISEGALLLIKDTSGNSCTIRTSSTAPCASWSGNIATIELDGQLPESFTAVETSVGAMEEGGDLKPMLNSVSVSSVSGTFDETKMDLTARGTEEDTYSLTFDTSMSFLVSGINCGDLISGTISSEYAPINPKTGQPYFIIPADCWSGIFEAGNSVTISTSPACLGFWIKEVVPTGCPHEPNNSFDIDWQID
jgi:hypothetical protein